MRRVTLLLNTGLLPANGIWALATPNRLSILCQPPGVNAPKTPAPAMINAAVLIGTDSSPPSASRRREDHRARSQGGCRGTAKERHQLEAEQPGSRQNRQG